MPIVSYFFIAGSCLIGLLFAADAVLPAREPLHLSSDFHGLAVKAPQAKSDIPILGWTSAPEPDMSSELVQAAQTWQPPASQPLVSE
jgi:hypothetical protein